MKPTIEALGLVRTYGRLRAFDGLDFVATTGVTGLLGPNGAGKTTLLRVLATVSAYDAGTVRILDEDPTTLRAG